VAAHLADARAVRRLAAPSFVTLKGHAAARWRWNSSRRGAVVEDAEEDGDDFPSFPVLAGLAAAVAVAVLLSPVLFRADDARGSLVPRALDAGGRAPRWPWAGVTAYAPRGVSTAPPPACGAEEREWFDPYLASIGRCLRNGHGGGAAEAAYTHLALYSPLRRLGRALERRRSEGAAPLVALLRGLRARGGGAELSRAVPRLLAPPHPHCCSSKRCAAGRATRRAALAPRFSSFFLPVSLRAQNPGRSGWRGAVSIRR
jgi:hypothetical protein